MSSKNRKYLYQKAKLEQLSNRKKEDNYDLRFTVLEKKKNYDALQDPHASYYFFSQSVKNHLRNIKTAAINETTHSVEKKKLKKLFKQKIKAKPNNFFINHPQIHGQGSFLTTQTFRKSSLQTVQSQRYKSPRKQSQRQTKNSINSIDRYHSLSKRHFNKTQNNHSHGYANNQQNSLQAQVDQQFQNTDKDQVQMTKVPNQNDQKLIKKIQVDNRKKRYQEIHEKRHKTFLNFIEEKKKLLKDFNLAVSLKSQ